MRTQLRLSMMGLCAGLLASLASASAKELEINVVKKEPPAQLNDSIREHLQPEAIQVLSGDEALYEFWLAKEIILKDKPVDSGKGLDQLRQSAFLGAVAVGKGRRDYKDGRIDPGVYTVRFALQPQDGNHLGTALYPYFALLVSSTRDQAPDAIKDYDTLAEKSAEETRTEHPINLALFPVAAHDAAGATAPSLSKPADEHQAVRIKTPAKTAGGDKVDLWLDLIVEGTGHL